MRKQLGLAPTTAVDAATRGYVDESFSALTTTVGSIEATDGTPPETPPDDGKFHLWFNTNGVEA